MTSMSSGGGLCSGGGAGGGTGGTSSTWPGNTSRDIPATDRADQRPDSLPLVVPRGSIPASLTMIVSNSYSMSDGEK